MASDHVKRALDVQWHSFLDALNAHYEACWEELIAGHPAGSRILQVDLASVKWTQGRPLEIGLDWLIGQEGNDDE